MVQRHELSGKRGRALFFALGAFFCLTSLAQAQAEPSAPPPDVRPPQVIDRLDAIYPPSDLKDAPHRDVVLNVTVDTQGRVANAVVTESGGAEMDDAALTAVRQWKFHPALRAGQPIATRIRVPFHFEAPRPPGPPAPQRRCPRPCLLPPNPRP